MPWRSDVIQHAFAFERTVVNPYNFATVLLPLHVFLFVSAVLVQYPRTGFYRTALLPAVLWLSYRSAVSLDFTWNNPGYALVNHLMVATMFSYAMRCATWAFVEHPYSRLPIDDEKNNASTDDISIFPTMWNALELLANPRGIGWSHGPPKVMLATPYIRVESRTLFGLVSLFQFILLATLFDIFRTSIQILGAQSFGRSEGGSIFDPLLPPLSRYIKSSVVTLLTGFAIYSLVDTVYHLWAMLFTMIFRHHPSYWPPIFDSPWLATSLGSFWGRRWHQFCREYFVGVGSKSMEGYLGRIGTIMGAFFISGIMHDAAMCQTAASLSVTGFFVIQGVGVVLEYAWMEATGRRVNGFVGWLWTIFWLVSWGNIVVDAWARSGLLGAEFGPDEWRPSVLFLNWISRKD